MRADLALTDTAGVAVVDDDRPAAHALPGTLVNRGLVVVSTGLLDALDEQERMAVLNVPRFLWTRTKRGSYGATGGSRSVGTPAR